MQVIQTIRDKGTAIVIIVIALSLIGFLLMDAKSGSSNVMESLTGNMGKVNSVAISKNDFDEKTKQAEQTLTQQAQQYGGGKPEIGQVRQQAWDMVVAQKVLEGEFEKLGLTFTSKELQSIFYSYDQGNPFLQGQSFIDPNTGQLDSAKVSQKIAEMKKAKGDEADSYAQLSDQLKMQSMYGKYSALLNASAYYPTWMRKKDSIDNSSFATISYVAVPYNSISDSTLKVSDAEIDAYVQSHKNQFKQEAGRMISYVTFSQLPNGVDSAAVKDQVAKIKDAFIADANPKNFVARNASVIPYDSNYLPKSKINTSYVDSIVKQPVGTVYGPYADGGNYALAKYLGSKMLPDSVKARHILIPTVNPQTGEPIAEDSTAKKQADSIFNAIKGGANFAQLAAQFSSDGSKDKGGDLGTFGYGAMVPEFNDFCFSKGVGAKDVVRTQFGYHIIEILSQKGSSPAYKIAFVAKEILASDATINDANLNATKLSAVKGGKPLEDYIAKNSLQKISWPTIVKENDYQVGQLRDGRTLVKWVFEAKKGDVSEPFNIENQFVVATVDKIQSEGLQDAATARQGVENIIRNRKKAEIIVKKLGTTPTLEKAAADYNQQVLTAGADSSITFGSRIIPNIGAEPKLIGASFNKAYQTKPSAPIEGETGVYVIKVNGVGTKAASPIDAAQQTATLRNQIAAGWFEALKKMATIKDNRSKYF